MRIATFNINNVVSRLDVLLDWLAQEEPDVVCLQELKAEQSWFPAEPLEQLGYQAVWKGQRTWNGVAILSRGTTPIVTRTAPARRAAPFPSALHRGGGQWRARRVPLPPQRQSGSWP